MEDDNPFQKAQTVDPEVRAYVYSLVNALGGSSSDEDGNYVLGDDALACLRDLKRWLKLYDEKTNRLDVARCLAEAKLVTGDLLPILSSWPENKTDKLKLRVALACLELLVPLTWPLETGGEMTVNHHRHTPYIQQSQVLYKAGVLGWDRCSILRQVVRIGLPSIAMARDERSNRDEGIIKLVLYFLRNIAVIRQIPNLPSQGLETEVSRSATIEAFRQQDVFALLLTICSNMGDDFNLQDVIVLEILFNLVKGVDVKRLWMTEQQRKGQEVNDLKDALSIEKSMHRDYKKSAPSRHGRFGTMIWVKRDDEKMSAVSGQNNLKDAQQALFNMDKSKKWNKPQQRRQDVEHSIHDFDRSVHITPSATELLRNFVEEFLDSGFNPLFTHLRKAIEREAERLQDINYRQFFYTVSWFLEAERVRREKQKKEVKEKKMSTDFEAESYALVAAVLNQETFITLNRYMQTSYDNKEWQDLSASMRCFTQILLTVQEMALSPLEEDQEIADNIQNRIFYEETTHDRIVAILKGYKDQGFGYLDACTELSHVFLKMLERYSKENADMQIRSRRRARRRKKEERQRQLEAGSDVQDNDEASENEDVADVAQVSRERKFDFTRFARKFTSQSSVDTFVAFTRFYRDLSTEQSKRAHRFFYRVAFKQELGVLLYRADIVALFYKMIKGPEGLDTAHELYQEWSELSRQLFKRMFKKLDQRPELMVELLFSKINATLHYLEYGQEKQTLASIRAPAELEVKPAAGRDLKEKIGIVVAALQNDEKHNLVRWVGEQLERAYDERHGWEAEAEARKAAAAVEDEAERTEQARLKAPQLAEAKPSYISVRPSTDEVRTAMFKNARLKLLMRLVGFEILGGEDIPGATWIVPSALPALSLNESKDAIEQFELTPWTPEHEDDAPENLLRRVRAEVSHPAAEDNDEEAARRDAFIDDSEGEDAVVDEDFLFPANVRSKSSKDALAALKKNRRKRKRQRHQQEDDGDDDDDDVRDARRKAREKAALDRRRKIKSELYIRDSDDEDGEDEEFFRREEEVRRRQEERVLAAMRLGRKEKAKEKEDDVWSRIKKKAREMGGKRRRVSGDAEDEDANGDADDDGDIDMDREEEDMQEETAASQSHSQPRHPWHRHHDSDSDEADSDAESTPPSSSHAEDDDEDEDEAATPISGKKARSLRELQQPRVAVHAGIYKRRFSKHTEVEDDDEGGEGEDEDGPVAPQPAIIGGGGGSTRRRVRAGFVIESDSDE